MVHDERFIFKGRRGGKEGVNVRNFLRQMEDAFNDKSNWTEHGAPTPEITSEVAGDQHEKGSLHNEDRTIDPRDLSQGIFRSDEGSFFM